jgi:endonuclease VIII
MPEGHTIHRAALDHARALVGQRVTVSSPQGRFDCTALARKGGVLLEHVEAHGKHLFYVFERGLTVHVHLGLFGRFTVHADALPAPSSSTRMRLKGKAVAIDLVGPTACELVTPEKKAALLGRIGPDPLQQPKAPKAFLDHLAAQKTPIGAVLLDQSVISGVGNVYRAEVLHLLKLHPMTPASSLTRKTGTELWRLVAQLLQRGVTEKRIVTTQGTKIRARTEPVSREGAVHVYGRNACLTCGAPVERLVLNARTAYLCGVCQPLLG